jgi:hypothetical protein
MARAKLGEILIQQGVIDASALKLALGAQIRFASQRMKIGQVLVDMGACTSEHVARALGAQLGVPYSDLTTANRAAMALLPVELCTKHQAMAIAAEAGPPEVVHVAFAEPLDLAAVDAVRSRIGKRIKAFIASPEAIAAKVAEMGGAPVAAVEGRSEGVDLGDVLFGDEGGGTMAIEHDEPGQARVPGAVAMADSRSVDLEFGDSGQDLFGRGGTPLPVATAVRGDTPTRSDTPPPSAAAPGADFDSLFGPSPVPGTSDPLAEGAVLVGTVTPMLEGPGSGVLEEQGGSEPVRIEDRGPPPTPVAVHFFADTRVKPKKVAPAPEAPSDLSGEALFGDAPAPAEESAGAPLSGTDFGEADLSGDGPTAPHVELGAAGIEGVAPPPLPELALFGQHTGLVGEESSGDHVPHDPSHRDHLFGAPDAHLVEHSGGEEFEPVVDEALPSAPLPSLPVPEPVGEWGEAAAPAPSFADADEPVDVDFTEVEAEPGLPPSAPAAAASEEEPAAEGVPASPTVAPAPAATAPEEPPPLSMSAATLRPPRPTPAAPLPAAPGRPATLPPPPRPPTAEPTAAMRPAAQPPAVESTPTVPALAQAGRPAQTVVNAATVEAPASGRMLMVDALPSASPASPPTIVAGQAEVASLASFAGRPLTEGELEVINAIERLADGAQDLSEVRQVKPAQMVAALVRLLIRQGVIQETDFLTELSRK